MVEIVIDAHEKKKKKKKKNNNNKKKKKKKKQQQTNKQNNTFTATALLIGLPMSTGASCPIKLNERWLERL